MKLKSHFRMRNFYKFYIKTIFFILLLIYTDLFVKLILLFYSVKIRNVNKNRTIMKYQCICYL